MTPRLGPQGAHFFDRKTGVNVLLDEVAAPPGDWSQAPRTLSVALANACDCRCPHCFAPKTDDVLSAAAVASWARETASAGGHSIGFGGGEPTLYPGLVELCHQVASETPLAVTLTTHGHNFDSALSSRLRGAVHFIRVSIGGLHTVYEDVHRRSFDRLLACLPAIRSTAPIGFNCLVNSRTIAYLDDMASFAVENEALEVLLLPEVSLDGTLSLDELELEVLASWIGRNVGRLPLALSVLGSEAIPAPVLPIGDPRGPSYDFLHVDAMGTLKTSAFSKRGVCVSSGGLMEAVELLRLELSTMEGDSQ